MVFGDLDREIARIILGRAGVGVFNSAMIQHAPGAIIEAWAQSSDLRVVSLSIAEPLKSDRAFNSVDIFTQQNVFGFLIIVAATAMVELPSVK